MKISRKFCESRDFLLPTISKWGKIAVLLLLAKFSASFSLLLAIPMYQKWRKTSCFAAIFKLFALLFSNSDEFQIFFRHFSESFQRKKLKKLKKSDFFGKFSELKKCESRDFLLPTISKWRELAVLLLFSKFSASFSLLLWLAWPAMGWKLKNSYFIFFLSYWLPQNYQKNIICLRTIIICCSLRFPKLLFFYPCPAQELSCFNHMSVSGLSCFLSFELSRIIIIWFLVSHSHTSLPSTKSIQVLVKTSKPQYPYIWPWGKATSKAESIRSRF